MSGPWGGGEHLWEGAWSTPSGGGRWVPSGRGNSLLWARWGFKGDNQHLEEQPGLVQLRPQEGFWVREDGVLPLGRLQLQDGFQGQLHLRHVAVTQTGDDSAQTTGCSFWAEGRGGAVTPFSLPGEERSVMGPFLSQKLKSQTGCKRRAESSSNASPALILTILYCHPPSGV